MDRAASEEQLATEVSTLMRLMHPVKAAAAREAGPGVGHDRSAMLLLFPLMHAPLRPGALAEASFADPSTISRQVAELVKRGLVRREPDPSDGRVQVSLMTHDATAPCVPDLSVQVRDVDAAHAAAVAAGADVVHPLTDEPWGVRRFFVRDGSGHVVNVLAHP